MGILVSLKIFLRIFHSVFISGLLLLCLMAFSANTRAENPTVKKVYESAIFVPWQFLSDSVLLSQSNKGVAHFDFDLGTLQFEVQQIPIKVSNIQVEIDTEIKSVGSSHGETLWQAPQMAVHINVGGFSVETYKEQWFGSVKSRVYLSATCSGFEITQVAAQMNMAWGWKSEGTHLEAALSSMDLTWPKSSWVLGKINCKGPAGFGDLVAAEVTKKMADPENFSAPIKAHLEQYFNKQIMASLEKYRKPQRLFSDLQTAMVMEMTGVEVAVEKGLLVKGIIEVERLQAAGAERVEELVSLDVASALKSLGTTVPSLVFPGKAAESLVADVAENRVTVYDLNRFEGFQKLLSSKFMQWFVWPDLMKYSKTSTFNVTSRVSGRPEIRYVPGQKMVIQGYVDSWIYSYRDGRTWRYVDVRSGFAAWVSPEVSDGQISFSFSGQNIKSAARMAVEYTNYYKPRSQIRVSTLEKAIKKAPFFQGFSLELPSIELENGLSLKASRLIRSDQDAFIIELVPASSEGVAGL